MLTKETTEYKKAKGKAKKKEKKKCQRVTKKIKKRLRFTCSITVIVILMNRVVDPTREQHLCVTRTEAADFSLRSWPRPPNSNSGHVSTWEGVARSQSRTILRVGSRV